MPVASCTIHSDRSIHREHGPVHAALDKIKLGLFNECLTSADYGRLFGNKNSFCLGLKLPSLASAQSVLNCSGAFL